MSVLVGVSIDSQFTHFAWRQTPISKGDAGMKAEANGVADYLSRHAESL